MGLKNNNLNSGEAFLNTIQNSKAIKEKIDKLDYQEKKGSPLFFKSIYKVQWKTRNKYFLKYISDKGLLSYICKELLKSVKPITQ